MGLRFSCVARGWGWVTEKLLLILLPHTPAKNPRPVSWLQAYIAYRFGW
jgi:hypothetical protein